jgi:hypothetical protein
VLEVQANRHLSALFAYYYRLSQQQQHVETRGQDEALLRPDVNSPAFPQAVAFIQQWNDLITYTAQELTNDQIQVPSPSPRACRVVLLVVSCATCVCCVSCRWC